MALAIQTVCEAHTGKKIKSDRAVWTFKLLTSYLEPIGIQDEEKINEGLHVLNRLMT